MPSPLFYKLFPVGFPFYFLLLLPKYTEILPESQIIQFIPDVNAFMFVQRSALLKI